MRLRTDSPWNPGWKRAVLLGARPDPRLTQREVNWSEDWLAFMDDGEEAKPGDVWRIYRADSSGARWSGFALTCPKAECPEGQHCWDHSYTCKDRTPEHVSCWVWTGTPEEGNLTASPSLHVVAERGGCGWHGWLLAGEMVG